MHSSLARAYAFVGDLEGARHHELEALHHDPISPTQHFNLGCVYMDLGYVEEARDCFKEALRLNPASANAWFNLAVVSKDADEIVACYRKALLIDPDDQHAGQELRRWEKLSAADSTRLARIRLGWAQQAIDRKDYSLARLQLALADELRSGSSHSAITDGLVTTIRHAEELGLMKRKWTR